jgi:hypothetical protein
LLPLLPSVQILFEPSCEDKRAQEPPLTEALKAASDDPAHDLHLDSAHSKPLPTPLLPLLSSVQILFEPSVMDERAQEPPLTEALKAASDDALMICTQTQPAQSPFPPFVTFATFCSNSLRTFCDG